jgi:hypothetical protein
MYTDNSIFNQKIRKIRVQISPLLMGVLKVAKATVEALFRTVSTLVSLVVFSRILSGILAGMGA